MTPFDTAVANFEAITVDTARERIASKDKFILLLGRPTCPYCNLFAPKLAQVAQETGAKITYINSEDPSQLEELQAFRNRYGIATVPGLFVAENGAAKVVCDSSLDPEDIADFIA